MVASKFPIEPQQRTVTFLVSTKFEPEASSLNFLTTMWLTRQSRNVFSAKEAGFGWNAKGQGTRPVEWPRREGGDPTDGSVLGRLLWKPTPNRQGEKEDGSKQREG